ncbi:MAG: hypothetical protein NT157_04255 [Candidatus Micrarchaeota archaeon]|nr:hypothetical protein [Candidatus Micrarchaeota archaeon]
MRGFLFTISFTLLFLLFLQFSVFYANAERERLAASGNAMAVRNENAIAADIAGDYEKLLVLDYSIERGVGNKLGLVVEGKLPVEWNVDNAASAYAAFVEESYANERNANINIELSPNGGAELEPIGLRHYYEGGGAVSIIEGNANEYNISLNVNDSCGECANGGSWEWAAEGVFIETEIYANGTRVGIGGSTGGYVDPATTNTLILAFDGGGSLSLSIGGSPAKVSVEIAGASADCRLAAYGIGSGEEARLVLPINVSVGDSGFEGLVLEKK